MRTVSCDGFVHSSSWLWVACHWTRRRKYWPWTALGINTRYRLTISLKAAIPSWTMMLLSGGNRRCPHRHRLVWISAYAPLGRHYLAAHSNVCNKSSLKWSAAVDCPLQQFTGQSLINIRTEANTVARFTLFGKFYCIYVAWTFCSFDRMHTWFCGSSRDQTYPESLKQYHKFSMLWHYCFTNAPGYWLDRFCLGHYEGTSARGECAV